MEFAQNVANEGISIKQTVDNKMVIYEVNRPFGPVFCLNHFIENCIDYNWENAT
jgi:hypothetical protein